MSTEPAGWPPSGLLEPDSIQPQRGEMPSTLARRVAVRAWSRVLDSLDQRIAELQRQRSAYLAQRGDWIRQAIGESGAPPDPA